jgi:hypothetical protein
MRRWIFISTPEQVAQQFVCQSLPLPTLPGQCAQSRWRQTSCRSITRKSTDVLPYPVRARENIAVATPIAWSKLPHVEGPNKYRAKDAANLRPCSAFKLLSGWGRSNQNLPGR